jgi:hypothetical protein
MRAFLVRMRGCVTCLLLFLVFHRQFPSVDEQISRLGRFESEILPLDLEGAEFRLRRSAGLEGLAVQDNGADLRREEDEALRLQSPIVVLQGSRFLKMKHHAGIGARSYIIPFLILY